LEPNPEDLLKLLHGWRDEAIKAGRPITRIAVAYETGRDSFWLARWLRERGIDAHVIHATSVAVSREHRCSATIWMGTQRQSGWPFRRSRREDICRGTVITQAIFS
jgi:transposase